ncbi:MAG: hypothetical protein JKY37_00460 [Nannocystaceae bacterium]|nr:hypothetical protein [Nannocystaceae bacterium]
MQMWGYASLGLVALLAACGGKGSSANDTDDGCTTNCSPTGANGDDSGDGGDTVGAESDADDGATEGDPDDGSGDGTPSAAGIPCDVAEVLAANCWSCHAQTPQFGASMPLTTFDDFQVPAPSDATRPVHELVAQRVTSDAMPMSADGSLSEPDRATLVDWVAGGALESDAQCSDPDPDPDPDPGVGPDALPCEVTQTFTAHANGGADDPFDVPLVDNLYQCFTFSSPLETETHISAWAPIVDDARVLHHWILYKTSEPQVDGGVGPCNMPGDAAFIAGWAPGGENFLMPDGVGLEFGGPSDSYILQIHYNNTAGYNDAADNSGVAFCTTPPKQETAGVLWLGTEDISIPVDAVGHEETGVCPAQATELLPGPLNIIASFPHMHQLGRALKTEIYRGGPGGTMETLVDANPFSFDNQVMYPHDPPVVLNPGDELVTQCTFDNTYGVPVNFGEDTEDEMCFNFIMAYPIQALPPQARVCTF